MATTASPPRAAPARRARRRLGHEQRRAAYLMLTPAVVHLVWWIGIPTVATFVLAFTHYDILAGTMTWAGLDNFVAIFGDELWRSSIWHTVVYTFFTVPVAMAIAVVIAALLNTKLRARAWYRTAIFMPHITATVAIALVWMWMFEPNIGLFNWVLSWFGIRGPAWLVDPAWAMPAVILMSIWKGIGLKMVIYLAALQGIPQDLYEAAEIDGAGPVRRFVSITLPQLGPVTFFVFVISLIDAFQVFEQFYVLTPDGGPANATTVMTFEIYKSAFQRFDMSTASAQSVVLFAFLLVLTFISRRATGRDDVH
ncbi:carbohydrate ABC transporter permease [Pseudonocardia sichuanensis]|uniref:Carbohydrate ABC transporter membrane protein 1 (CUT1 family) n=1 Tax=Pseudonocardia kunmingensis TaxID=630975 RepID=A0A543D178_9PSEU|nr:sugar ABC transporter permease [Pseudonocardia kunmingensis]TQM03087.1 carbohydrate ABC transporter membrane protein 1 (CUT1 family) [Pseudonocardia kunmingensis]